jgi:membrane associated rhomboid family serine protease
MKKTNQFGYWTEALVYPLLLIAVLWIVFWADHLFDLVDFYKMGIKPKTMSGLKGIIFMPFIHDKTGYEHIVNNSLPIGVLLGALIYYYREIALKVFVLTWVVTGVGLWVFAANNNSFHIGISGVIYGLASFLFVSGVLRKYLPLQAISLFVAFVYGSLIWGIFPMKAHVSWEGHLSGMVAGIILAFVFRKRGPQSPKYLYEIEKELGIEPPDFEGELKERERLYAESLLQNEREQIDHSKEITIKYIYKPNSKGETDRE